MACLFREISRLREPPPSSHHCVFAARAILRLVTSRSADATSPIPHSFALILAAALIILVTTGTRQVTGLFVQPIIASTGVSIAALSFSLAIGQFVWGAAQPVFGALADKFGAFRVLLLGALLMSAGLALTAFAKSAWAILLTLGVLSAAGAAAGSFSILIGGTARQLSPSQRSLAAGSINAGGSLGQFVFAPVTNAVIGAWGWGAAMFTLAVSSLLTIPLAWPLRRRSSPPEVKATDPKPVLTLRQQLRIAVRHPSYIYLNLGFFTCGFHVAFLVTHLPGEIQNCGLASSVAANSVALIGLFNVVGSIGAGLLGQRFRMKNVLAGIYGARAALIAIYLLMPKTALNMYLFAATMGLTWLATVPPTSGIVGKLFGVRYLGTLFGLTLVSHQTGAFLGAWLGGVAMARLGSYQWIWYADMALALLAALVNLPIREDKPLQRAAVAA
jgi:predicted MFS family arabinose efflux permease